MPAGQQPIGSAHTPNPVTSSPHDLQGACPLACNGTANNPQSSTVARSHSMELATEGIKPRWVCVLDRWRMVSRTSGRPTTEASSVRLRSRRTLSSLSRWARSLKASPVGSRGFVPPAWCTNTARLGDAVRELVPQGVGDVLPVTLVVGVLAYHHDLERWDARAVATACLSPSRQPSSNTGPDPARDRKGAGIQIAPIPA